MKPFEFTSGPHNAPVIIVGEAWGESEDKFKTPFVGYSGLELARLLVEAGLCTEAVPGGYVDPLRLWQWWGRQPILLTNVLAKRPPNNNLDAFCGTKADVGKDYKLPPLRMGNYLMPEHLPEVERLRAEIEAVQPNLIIALGNTACWAILGTTKISAIRGTITASALVPGTKTLPTYHPSAVLRNWALRPVVLADLLKAKRESAFPQIVRPAREVIVDPTLADIAEWLTRPASMYAVDIETKRGQIECIGFARSASDAIVVPFITVAERSYWGEYDEVTAWALVGKLLQSDALKIFQNGLFDLQYILKMGFKPKNCIHDTMLLHHALYPELQKGLGFLGSIYSNESSWKLMRHHHEEYKKDE